MTFEFQLASSSRQLRQLQRRRDFDWRAAAGVDDSGGADNAASQHAEHRDRHHDLPPDGQAVPERPQKFFLIMALRLLHGPSPAAFFLYWRRCERSSQAGSGHATNCQKFPIKKGNTS